MLVQYHPQSRVEPKHFYGELRYIECFIIIIIIIIVLVNCGVSVRLPSSACRSSLKAARRLTDGAHIADYSVHRYRWSYTYSNVELRDDTHVIGFQGIRHFS